MKQVIKNILYGLFLLIVIIYVLETICQYICGQEYFFMYKTSIVLSGSMEPTINVNDYIIIKKEKKLHINDIVVYKMNDVLVVHRIVEINGNNIITKGDANNTVDQPISKEQILGKYIGKIKYLGKIIKFIQKPIVFSAIITFITYLFIKSLNKRSDNSESK